MVRTHSRALRYFGLTDYTKEVGRVLFGLGPEAETPSDVVRLAPGGRRMLELETSFSAGTITKALDELECANIIVREGSPRIAETITIRPPFVEAGSEIKVVWTALRASVLYACDLTLWSACHGRMPCQRLARDWQKVAGAQGELFKAEQVVDKDVRETLSPKKTRIPTGYVDGLSCRKVGAAGLLSSGSSGVSHASVPSGRSGEIGGMVGGKERPAAFRGESSRRANVNDPANGVGSGASDAEELVRLARKAFGERCTVRLEGLVRAYARDNRRVCYESLCQALDQRKPIRVPHAWLSTRYVRQKRRYEEKRARGGA